MKFKSVHLILIIFLILSAPFASAARQITTFTIHYADPVQIQTAVRSYLSSGSSVSLYQNRLILNATEAEIAKTQSLLRQLDVGGRQLLISVKTSGQGSQSQQHMSVSGSVVAGGGMQTETHATVTLRNHQMNGSESGGQGIRATEGRPAYISVGSSALIHSYRTTADGRLIQEQNPVSATSGFYATAWVNGNAVRITINQQRQQLQGKVIAGQQLQSEVDGILGRWLPVGMTNESSQRSGSGIGAVGSGKTDFSETIYLKVDLLD